MASLLLVPLGEVGLEDPSFDGPATVLGFGVDALPNKHALTGDDLAQDDVQRP